MSSAVTFPPSASLGPPPWPFSFSIGQFEGLQNVPSWSDIASGPAKLVQVSYMSAFSGVMSSLGYMKVYNKANPQIGVDDPDIVIPVPLEYAPGFDQIIPLAIWEDGVPGMYFDHISVAMNGDLGTGEEPYTDLSSEFNVMVEVMPVDG